MLSQSERIPFSKPARAMSRRRGLLAAATLAATVSAAAPAWAQDHAYAFVMHVDPATIQVLGDGETYTTVPASAPAIAGEIHMHMSTGGSGRIRSWAVWPTLWIEETDAELQLPAFGQSASYELDERPKNVTGDFPFSIPRSAYRDFALQACNARALHLRQNAGMTDEEIFSEDREITGRVVDDLTYDFSGLAGVVLNDPLTPVFPHLDPSFKIVCAKSASLVATPLVPKVEFVDLKVAGSNNNTGACSLSMVASIRSKEPDTVVKFHFESKDGNRSDTKTVGTSAAKLFQKGYEYPLQAGHVHSGQVRMVIEGEDTKSDWQDYEANCQVNDLQTLLPPEVVHLEVAATAKKGVYRGHVCPAEVKVIGVFKGRGSASGTAVLTVNNVMRVQRDFNVDDKESKAVDYVQSLSWAGIDGPLQQDIDVALVLQNANGEMVDSLAKTQTVSCVEADKPDQFVSNDPTPPVLSLSMRRGERRLYQGYMCPERVVLRGRVWGQDDFDGRAVFVVRQEQSLVESQSQVKEFNFAVTEDENLAFVFEPKVRWSNVPQNGDAPPKQTMDLTFQVVRHGAVATEIERSLEVSCEGVSIPNLVTILAPPKAIGLQADAMVDKVHHRGHVCPAKAQITGAFEGQGSASGTATLIVNGVVEAEAPYSIEDGQTKTIVAEHDLAWSNVGAISSNVSLALRLYDEEGNEVDTLTNGQSFECRKPEPPALQLASRLGKGKLYQGYICPESVALYAGIKGQDDFLGRAAFVVRQEQSLHEAQSQVKEFNFAVAKDETLRLTFEPEVRWSNVPQSGDTPPKQTLDVSVQIVSAGEIVESVERPLEVSCRAPYFPGAEGADLPEPAVGGPAISGLSTGDPSVPHAQQGRTPAALGQLALQTGPAFAVQAPKGRVRDGRIQLSGGEPNAKYDLRFYRGDKGGFKRVRSAQLPRQMTGRTARFNLRALSGGLDWRIEVCPAGKAGKAACKTSDFRILQSGAAGKVKAPGTQGDAKVFILPGGGN